MYRAADVKSNLVGNISNHPVKAFNMAWSGISFVESEAKSIWSYYCQEYKDQGILMVSKSMFLKVGPAGVRAKISQKYMFLR